ncbi:hypothetical protein NLI96_g1364 [Meripilus lineatus]|uniref:FMR1-interacting protein 1 conserved domain-containing protein n=1 Tax=Meripilus lineatus TaxID=2056292 RepID=A0AAD5VB20_9APHY|nr:hypothetical protein NLI96_g1364 [Physisporinus lineatus]
MQQPRRGLPFHPSLPAPPHLRQNPQQAHGNPGRTQHYAPIAGPSNPPTPGVNSLTQIQAQAWQASYALSPHYAQAYMQYNAASLPGGGSPWPMTTSEGYTYSSTFVPGQQSQPFPSTSFSNGGLGTGSSGFPFQTTPAPPSQSWYSPGNARCKQAGCRFSGSAKAVELHMMDRHLVYPPGWDKRKKRPDWDADPSLKGKPIPIMGTNIKLDTPEAIQAWIAERKKRFPTASKVQEKQQKMDEAIARGQLPLDDDSRFPHRKRRKLEQGSYNSNNATRGFGMQQGAFRGRGGSRGRGRGRGSGGDRGRRGIGSKGGNDGVEGGSEATKSAQETQLQRQPSSAPAITGVTVSSSDGESGSDSDEAPEEVSSKTPAVKDGEDKVNAETSEGIVLESAPPISREKGAQSMRKPAPKQPRKPLHNPFASRPSLLRNLLLPEIRMTVSNLSQAIHFLVDNNFLDNVELKPGQANERMIEVIDAHHEVVVPSKPTVSNQPEEPSRNTGVSLS